MDNDKEGFILTNLIVNHLGSERSQSFMKENLRCTTKCVDTSRSLRKEGNELYTKRLDDHKMKKIFKLYTKSIAYAPNDSQDLVRAFGNRSAILQKMNKHEECLVDINRALALGTSDWQFKVRLLCRKVECLAALGDSDCKKVYNEAISLLPENINQYSKLNFILNKIKSTSLVINKFHITETRNDKNKKKHMSVLSKKDIENLSTSSVTVQCDENYGKHLVAARDIKPGEIICVDKLYVSCLNLNNSHAYCSHCFAKSWVNIPCDYCNWCMFCSEECKKLAWNKYHDFECVTVSYLISNHEIDYYDHLSLRSLFKSIKESGSISKFKADLQSADKYIEQNCQSLQKGGFKRSIFSNTQFKNISKQFMQKCVINSAIVLLILSKYTKFFGQNWQFQETQDLLKNEDVLFIGSTFLKIRKNTFTTTHLIKEKSTDFKFFNDVTTYKLACLIPINFYINRSCYPNIANCITSDQRVIIFALQPIQKNFPLFMPYYQAFFNLEKSIRQRFITQNMSFICQCIACKRNWPTLNELYKMPKENPFLYAKTYNNMESELFDENNTLVKSILNSDKKMQYNKATLMQLTKAIEKALKHLVQPSVVICELMTCLEIVFEKLYNS